MGLDRRLAAILTAWMTPSYTPPVSRSNGHRSPILEDASDAGARPTNSVIANGYLRLDREEWIRVVEKRSAALQGRRS